MSRLYWVFSVFKKIFCKQRGLSYWKATQIYNQTLKFIQFGAFLFSSSKYWTSFIPIYPPGKWLLQHQQWAAYISRNISYFSVCILVCTWIWTLNVISGHSRTVAILSNVKYVPCVRAGTCSAHLSSSQHMWLVLAWDRYPIMHFSCTPVPIHQEVLCVPEYLYTVLQTLVLSCIINTSR